MSSGNEGEGLLGNTGRPSPMSAQPGDFIPDDTTPTDLSII